MDVFGLEPIQATIVVTVIGVMLQVGLGCIQSGNTFDGRKLLTSAIIALVASLIIVATAIQAIPEGTDDLSKFIILIGVIAAVAGIDQLIKNTGNCLVYYFPESSNIKRKFGFMSCLECSLAMIERHDNICKILSQNNLPCVNYRVSADYGSVAIMKTNNSESLDMIGPPVNMCCKINHTAATNGMVIGGDLYSMVKHFGDYRFKEANGFDMGFKYLYPVYYVKRK